MKKKHIFAALALATMGMALNSCSDDMGANYEQKDELYRQMISFKAPVGTNGVYDIYMRYKEDGTASYKLPVLVSGTTTNKRDITVNIGVDNDTLSILNTERFAVNREDLWFRQLPSSYYTLASSTCTIPAGENQALYPIEFNMTGIDLTEKWVLPLTVLDGDYEKNTRKGYYKALLNINLFNDYSGSYASNTMNVYIGDETNDPATVSTRTCRVVDDKTVFFYAGTVWEEDANRSLYKVYVKFEDGVEQADGSIRGKLTLTSGDPENKMNLEAYGDCYYTYSKKEHATKPAIERRLVTLFINYRYSDITSDPSNPMRMRATGTMSLERLYNTLIPDEEQAYQW